MPICLAQRPSRCLSVCFCACPQPDCFGAHLPSARRHPQTSLCLHPESISRPCFVHTNGIKLFAKYSCNLFPCGEQEQKPAQGFKEQHGSPFLPCCSLNPWAWMLPACALQHSSRPASYRRAQAAHQPTQRCLLWRKLKMDWVWKTADATYVSSVLQGLRGTALGGCLLLEGTLRFT